MPILNRKLRNYKELGWPEATEVEKKVEWEEDFQTLLTQNRYSTNMISQEGVNRALLIFP